MSTNDTPLNKEGTPQPTGRRYNSVIDLLNAEGFSEETRDGYIQLAQETRVTRVLSKLRTNSGLTQAELGERIGRSQSAVSKIESGRDEDLTLAEVRDYAHALNERVGILLGPPFSHVDAIKAYALGMKERMFSLAKLAHKDEEMEKEIQAFFGEAFFNILNILGECQGEMPNGDKIDIRVEVFESPRSKPKKIGSKKQVACC